MKSIFAPFCGVVEARDGQEALDICKKSVPDLIITDVMMPVVRQVIPVETPWLTRAAGRFRSDERIETAQAARYDTRHYAVGHASSPLHGRHKG